MAAPVRLRSDFDAAQRRALAKRSRDPDQTRRIGFVGLPMVPRPMNAIVLPCSSVGSAGNLLPLRLPTLSCQTCPLPTGRQGNLPMTSIRRAVIEAFACRVPVATPVRY